MANKKLNSTLKFLGKTGFTVLLVYLVFQKIDFDQVKQVMLRSQPVYLLAAIALYFISQVISSWRLLGFLHLISIPVAFGFNFRLYLLGMFYNVFLPGGVGGDGYKIYLLNRKFGRPVKSLLGCFLLDRASGLWAISILAAICLFFIPGLRVSWTGWYPVLLENTGAPIYWVPIVYILAAIVSFYFVWRFFFRVYLSYFPIGITRALAVQLLQSGAVLLIIHSLHAGTSYQEYLFSFLVANIATVIPLSVGGLGLREYVMLQLAVVMRLDPAVAVATSLLFYVISTIAAMPGIFFVYRSKEFARDTPVPQAL